MGDFRAPQEVAQERETQCRFLHTRRHYISWYFSLNDKLALLQFTSIPRQNLKWFLILMGWLIPTKMSPDFEDVVNDELHEYQGSEWSKHHRFAMITFIQLNESDMGYSRRVLSLTPSASAAYSACLICIQHMSWKYFKGIKMRYVTTDSHEVYELITDLQTHMNS